MNFLTSCFRNVIFFFPFQCSKWFIGTFPAGMNESRMFFWTDFWPFPRSTLLSVVISCLLVSLSFISRFRLKGLLFGSAAEAQLVSASWAAVSYFLPKLCDWTLNSLVLHLKRHSDGVPWVILTTRAQPWKWPGFCYQSNETMRGWNLVFSSTLKSFVFVGGGGGEGWRGGWCPSFKTSPLWFMVQMTLFCVFPDQFKFIYKMSIALMNVFGRSTATPSLITADITAAFPHCHIITCMKSGNANVASNRWHIIRGPWGQQSTYMCFFQQ